MENKDASIFSHLYIYGIDDCNYQIGILQEAREWAISEKNLNPKPE